MDERAENPACPSLETLEHYYEAGETDDAVRTHVVNCAACAEKMRDIRANDDLLSQISGLSGDVAIAPGASAGAAKIAGGEGAGGQEIPGYRIVREIHRGGQGIVWEAVQESTGRRVAVKTLAAGALATREQRLRFEREIEVVARLRHPGIVTVFDSGRTADGRHYFSMELVEGAPLDVGAMNEAGDLRATLGLFRKMCDAVAYAHQRGIIHRDLKPANILVDAGGEARVVDFGLAREAESRDRATVTGHFVGTFAYAAPEQVAGDPDAIDVRTDVYALGVILYELLTGSAPYPTNVPPVEVIRHIEVTEPRDPRAIRLHLDADLATIVLKALSKEKSRRYASAGALLEDLDHHLAGRPINARRDSTFYVLSKMARRHRLPIVLAGAALVALVAFSITVTFLYRRSVVEMNKTNTIRIFLEDTLASVEPRVPGQDVTVAEVLDEAVHWVDLALADQPEIAATMRTTIGNSYRVMGRHDDAHRQLELALATRRELFGERHADVAATMTVIGLTLTDEGRLEEAVRVLEDALELRREVYGARHPGAAGGCMNLARALSRAGEHERAIALLREALAIRTEHSGAEHPDVAMVWYLLGEAHDRAGAVEEALEAHERALAVREHALDPAHPDLHRSVLAAGVLSAQARRPEAGAAHLQRWVDEAAAAGWASPPSDATARFWLAVAVTDLGRADEAAGLLSDVAERIRYLAPSKPARQAALRAAQTCRAAGRGDEGALWEALAAELE